MRDRLIIEVSFDERAGYVARHPELPTVSALSLKVLRHRIHARVGGAIEVRLDRSAAREDARRRQWRGFR